MDESRPIYGSAPLDQDQVGGESTVFGQEFIFILVDFGEPWWIRVLRFFLTESLKCK
jgi:hypothetical protein